MHWVLLALGLWLAGCSEAPPPATNRLAAAPSRYLQAHADNPVDWYPWGEEAFARARREDKPVFVSIGYLACHWCHVMEEESFRDPEVAALLNRDFISVKVDREERPDLDHRFMTYLVAQKGSGGWPLSVFLTPEGAPFYAGTYFPPREAHGLPSFTTVLERIHKLWQDDRGKLTDEARRAMADLEARSQARFTGKADAAAQRRLAEGLRQTLSAPAVGAQFPQLEQLRFLLRYGHRTGEKWPLQLVLARVEKMLSGGLKDHVGGGFHRYSVDPEWRVPHFEKMLVDQADWTELFLELYQLTGDERWARECRQVLGFVVSEMVTTDELALATSLDADSGEPPREGEYYVWKPAQVRALIGHDLALADGVVQRGLDDGEGSKLLEARRTRPEPQRDELFVTAIHARMVRALARAGLVLGEVGYRATAFRFGSRLAGPLQHSPGVPAFGLDYAEAIAAVLALYESLPRAELLQRARAWQKELDKTFADPRGGYFEGRDKPRSHQEHATDALESENLTRLGDRRELPAVEGNVAMALSAEMRLAPERRVVVTGDPQSPAFHALWKAAASPYCPGRRLICAREAASDAPDLQALAAKPDVAAYVCQGTRCSAPLGTAEAVRKALR